jgi:hypothetical protein
VPDLRAGVTDPDTRSLAAAARERRFEMFLDRFPALGDMTVLDLGGEAHTWLNAPVHAQHVTLLNLPRASAEAADRITAADAGAWMVSLAGDACDPPAEIRDRRFDLVYSNSVIEHVGGHLRRRQFARWVHELGERHWVQTPNRFFPVEPHWLVPGLQFATPRLQVAVLQRWPYTSKRFQSLSWQDRLDRAMGIELLSPSAFRSYFPDYELVRERLYGLTKSLIAVR